MSLPELPFLENESLTRHTTYRIGGPARYLALPESLAHLESLATYLRSSHEPYAILGNGSNMLAPDDGFPGWVIKTTNFAPFLVRLQHNHIHASAGLLNARVLRACAEQGLSGLEYLAGVPGTIGGAVWMNAGTASGWIEQNLVRVESFSFSKGRQSYSEDQLKFSYREQHFLDRDEIILSAVFQMMAKEPAEIVAALAESARKRKEAQPIEMPSCGSVFRNPPGTSAWKCVEQVGLKGHKVGGARFSLKHSNFIVNEGGATRADVLALIALAKERVKLQLGIELQEEVIVLRPYSL